MDRLDIETTATEFRTSTLGLHDPLGLKTFM